MNVLAINGSPRVDGNTTLALSMMAKELAAWDISFESVQVTSELIRPCKACAACKADPRGLCVITTDGLNEVALKARAADGIIIACPTYYGGISGNMKCFLDRLFYANSRFFKHKVGASLSIARRAASVDVVHQLNNYFLLSEMIIAPSQYWPVVYGTKPGEILGDPEGMQTIEKAAQSMGWLLKVLESATAQGIPAPKESERAWTNFIR
jgi:multimeric flavodoxin WrbA